MLSSFTVDGLGVICLALFGVFYWLGIFATARAILAFVGTCLIGTAGFLGSGLQAVTAWLVGLANSGTLRRLARPPAKPVEQRPSAAKAERCSAAMVRPPSRMPSRPSPDTILVSPPRGPRSTLRGAGADAPGYFCALGGGWL